MITNTNPENSPRGAGAPSPAPPRIRRRTSSKDRAGDAWAVWRSTGSDASAAQFYASISSWTQGTAAQLLRPLWPVGVPRPTSIEVESRLRDKLKSSLSDHSDYLGALRIARDAVVEELQTARGRHPRGPSS